MSRVPSLPSCCLLKTLSGTFPLLIHIQSAKHLNCGVSFEEAYGEVVEEAGDILPGQLVGNRWTQDWDTVG